MLRFVPKQGEPPPRLSSSQSASAACARPWCPEPLCPAAPQGPAGCSVRAVTSPSGVFCLSRALQHKVGPPQSICLQTSPPFSLEPTSPTRRRKGPPCSDIAAYCFKGKSLLVEILVCSKDSAGKHYTGKQTQNVGKEGLKDLSFQLLQMTDQLFSTHHLSSGIPR